VMPLYSLDLVRGFYWGIVWTRFEEEGLTRKILKHKNLHEFLKKMLIRI